MATASGELFDTSAFELGRLYRSGGATPAEVVDAVLRRIERLNPAFRAYVHVDWEEAVRSGAAATARFRTQSDLGPLDGIPVGIKDLIDVAGMPTRRGSLATPSTRADRDAPAASRLRAAGAILIGKTSTSEFGWKGVTESPLSGTTPNPWDRTRAAGGSSGGAAVACALGMGTLHLATDGAGSIRIPAAFCGVFGFKPTFGRVGHAPPAHTGSLFHAGPIARTPADAALLLDTIAYPDARDWQSLPRPAGEAFAPLPAASVAGLDVGLVPSPDGSSVHPDILRVLNEVGDDLRAQGAHVNLLDPVMVCQTDCFRTLWHAAAAKLVRRLPQDRRAEVDPALLAVAAAGAALPLAQVQDAEEARAALGATMGMLQTRYRLLVMPTLPVLPFPVGRDVPDPERQSDWLDWTPFTYPWNMTQQPAASVPRGWSADGMPIGIQLVAARHSDLLVLRVAQLLARDAGGDAGLVPIPTVEMTT